VWAAHTALSGPCWMLWHLWRCVLVLCDARAGCAWRMCTFVQAAAQRDGAREEDGQGAEREQREAQDSGEVDFKGCEVISWLWNVVVWVLRTRCLADFWGEQGDNHCGRGDERRGLGGYTVVSWRYVELGLRRSYRAMRRCRSCRSSRPAQASSACIRYHTQTPTSIHTSMMRFLRCQLLICEECSRSLLVTRCRKRVVRKVQGKV
jgi:hypothetical protein